MRFTFEEDFIKPSHTRRKSDPGLDAYLNKAHSNVESAGVFSPIGQTIVYPAFIHDRAFCEQ